MPEPDPSESPSARRLRWVYLLLGWAFFAIGVAGAFLPVLPTTPLMILALWAFARSSRRLHDWLYTHRTFGPPLQRWQEYRVIPPSAKMASVGAMAVSFGALLLFSDLSPLLLAATAALMAYGAWYVLTKPSAVPAGEEERS